MKKFILILLVLPFFTISCKEESSEGKIKIVTTEEMKELSQLEDVQLVDVRTPQEYNEGYIDGFQNIDFYSPDFESKIEKLDKSRPVIVYCKSGNRSGKCAAMMEGKGFVKIYDLKGGIEQWKYEGNDLKINP